MKPQQPVIVSQGKQLKKTKSTSLTIITIASVIVVFCLVASKTLLSEAAHQRRVLNAKHAAVNQLKADISAINTLSSQYKAFGTNSTNIIGGSASGTGANDGNNVQIVLDALPSQYDFPGLTASVEKLISLTNNVKLNSINGIDDESANVAGAVPNPTPTPMLFSFTATTNYASVQTLFHNFGLSIRPFHVVSLQLSGTNDNMTVSTSINTFFQPAKSLSIKEKGVQ